MVYIEILVYPSVTNCNKTVCLEKKSGREENKSVTRATNGKKIKKGRNKNVTSVTNGFYREYFVSVCNKVQQDCIS